MALVESLPGAVASYPLNASFDGTADVGVIWMRGEHDLDSVVGLAVTLARAMTRDDSDVVVDLSGVEFMGSATVGLFVRAREALGLESRSLVLRSPSRCAERILGICGVASVVSGPSVAGSSRRRADGSTLGDASLWRRPARPTALATVAGNGLGNRQRMEWP